MELAAWGALAIAVVAAACASVYCDARRRTGRAGAVTWALGAVVAPPVVAPCYIAWAYRRSPGEPEPPIVLPLARVVLYVGCSLCAAVVVGIPCMFLLGGTETGELVTSAVVCVALILVTYAFRRWVDRRPASSIGTPLSARSALEALLGGAAGAGMVIVFSAVLAARGHLIVARAPEANWPRLTSVTVLLAVAAFCEEITFRGYLYRAFHDQWRAIGAVLVPSAVFGLVHAANPSFTWLGLTNIILVGVFLALAVVATDRLWFAAGAHFAWNMMIGPVLGLPVSGINEFGRLIDTRLTGPDFVTGGDFGPEGSVVITALLVVAVAMAAATARYVARRRPLTTLALPPAEA